MMKAFIFTVFSVSLTFASVFSPTAHAEKLKWLENDQEALQARVDIIQQAKQEIVAEYFHVAGDEMSLTGFAVLRQAARRGVKVKIIVDAMNDHIPAPVVDVLSKEPNMEIRLFNSTNPFPFSWTHRDHTKLLAVDGKIMVVGGRNIACVYFSSCADGEADHAAHFQDLDAIVTGPAVQVARDKNFYALWNNEKAVTRAAVSGSSDNSSAEADLRRMLAELEAGHRSVKSQTRTNWETKMSNLDEAQFLYNDPNFDPADPGNFVLLPTQHQISQGLFKIVSTRATKSLTILTPYLFPSLATRDLFRQLIKNGVKIKIITNSLKSTDNFAVQAGYRSIKDEMIKMGIELHEYQGPKTAHAKTMEIESLDGSKYIWVGSYNLDPRSENINREIGIFGKSDRLGDELKQIISHFEANTLLVGANGQAVNQSKWDEGVPWYKLMEVRSAETLLPLLQQEI